MGKSFLVRMFAKEKFENICEVNLERHPASGSLFESNDPRTILNLLEARFGGKIQPGKTLLFLDEIQSAPGVLGSLRYFHEELPELHVISAGSLLEFALEEPAFSMPVGRIEYLHLGPMQFEEFLLALDKGGLHRFLCEYSPAQQIPAAIHGELTNLLRQFLIVGGLPEAVALFAKTHSYRDCDEVKESILATYRDDFNKYGRLVRQDRVEKIFSKIPLMVGNRFKYSHVDREERSKDLQAALRLLSLAKVAVPVCHSSANGIPLGAEKNNRIFKVLFLDVGLLCKSCGLGALEIEKAEDLLLVNAGSVCEQFVGQHLLYAGSPFEEPELYFWVREEKNSNAEVDYLFTAGSRIIPVEVKSGKSGSMKSLQLFLREKKILSAVRFDANPPSVLRTQTSLSAGTNVPFELISLPLYAVGQLRRLTFLTNVQLT